MENSTRRHFLSYVAGSLGVVATSGFLWIRRQTEPRGPYQVIDSWKLPIGGLGLFITTDKAPSRTSLDALSQSLQREYESQPNMVVSIFDDAAAARTVRKGSRVVGEDAFQAAMAHQVAFYVKDARIGRHTLTVHSEPREEIQLGAA